jgi:peptidoglycan/xylan/chitin deacetylase (PgdA/CDA1 family)
MYHNVGDCDPGSNPDLTISTSEFTRHLRWFARHGYSGITASQLVAQRKGSQLPKKPLLLTFDDAYSQCARTALPILTAFGFTATVFVVTSEIGGTNSWDQVIGIAKQSLMSKDQILHWSKMGIEFGAHTHTHPDLRSMKRCDVQAQMIGSRDDLGQILNKPVLAFAYPYGCYNLEIVECARSLFSIAFTCDPGLNDAGGDLLRQRRTEVRPEHAFLYPRALARLGYDPVKRYRETVASWKHGLAKRISGSLGLRELDKTAVKSSVSADKSGVSA